MLDGVHAFFVAFFRVLLMWQAEHLVIAILPILF